MFEQQAKHIAYIIAEAQNRGATTVEPSQEGQDAWVRTVRELAIDNSAFELSCTPGYYNNEGRGGAEGNGSFLGDFYSPGFYAFDELLAEWRAKGDLDGLDLGRVGMADLRFDGRVAVVTGGGRGLGRSYALLLAAQGAKVVVNDPGGSLRGGDSEASRPPPDDATPADDVVREITAAGGEAVVQHRLGGHPGRRQGDHRHGAGHLRPHRHPHPQRRNRPSRVAEGDDLRRLRGRRSTCTCAERFTLCGRRSR